MMKRAHSRSFFRPLHPCALLPLLALSCAAAATAAAPPPSAHDVTFLSATPFDGKNYADAMPLGNGRVTALAWGNASTGGLELYIRSPTALHLDSQVFTIARLSVALSPSPCGSAGGYWNQSLSLAEGAVTLTCGAAAPAGARVTLRAFADARADAIVVTAAAADGATPYSLTASLTSVRPAARFSYTQDFTCGPSSSGPDVLLGGGGGGGLVGLYHVNSAASGDFSLFNFSMLQQGLAPLLASFADPLEGRIFGAALAGGAGADGGGAPLARASASALVSAAPAPAFALLLAVRVDAAARGDAAAFEAALSAAAAAPVAAAARAAATRAHWGDFWARSYFAPADDPAPPSPDPPPPSAATLGAFPCGGALAARQAVARDAATGALTFPLGLCLQAPFDGWVDALPCSNATAQPWRLVPCTARGCAADDFWVLSPLAYPAGARQVLGFDGATPPWVGAWTADDPTGDCKNELFYYNASDSTLRAKNCNSPGQCLTVAYAGPPPPPPPGGSLLADQYARTRFIHAVQGGGGVDAPIPFNGMLMTNQAGAGGPADVDYRQWGPNAWFQNTRMPYEAMLAAGDAEGMRVVLDWIAGFAPLLRARTALLLPGEQGIFATETVTISGLFQLTEYGCDAASGRPAGYPPWLEGPGSEGGWVRYDYGGNGFAEAGLMALDYYFATLDAEAAARYIPIATGYIDFYASHYRNRTADGRLLIWPAQVLESWWCEWGARFSDACCQNDLPNVAALHALLRGALALPAGSGLLTPAQRAAYAALQAILPPLPREAGGATYAAAEVLSTDAGHNSEGPWLYGTHPFRLETVGAQRAAAGGAVNLTVARATWRKQGWFASNSGWSYGIINAAYLGFAQQAYAMALDRARQPPPPGYRFPAFAQHYQDYPPSADHFAVLSTAVQAMLLQGGEDAAGSITLLPGWPCEVDVSFKLWGTANTSVELVWRAGAAVSLVVTPPERAAAVSFAPCNSTEREERVPIKHFST